MAGIPYGVPAFFFGGEQCALRKRQPRISSRRSVMLYMTAPRTGPPNLPPRSAPSEKPYAAYVAATRTMDLDIPFLIPCWP